jgi:phage portal protein BeeE
MNLRSTVYPTNPARVQSGKIVAPAVEKAGGIASPFNRVMDGDSFLDRHPLPRPMQQSVWVMSSIKMIAEPISAVPLDFKMVADDGTETPFKNPALKSFWEKPAKGLSYEEFISALVGWNKLKGEIFIILDDSWFVRGMKKNLPIVARPDSMREVISNRDLIGVDRGELVGWVWTDPTGTKHQLIPAQVIHQKEWNPYNNWRGLAEMEAARIAAEADYLQGKFAGNLAKNNGDQGVFVIATGNPPTEAQQTQIVEALRMKRLAAMRGELRPVFLSSDIKIEDPKIQTPDADFVAQRLENRHEIAIAFRVPPSMFDIVASYSIGQASDRYRLIEDACMPMGKKLTKIISTLSRMLLGLDPDSTLTGSFNWESHSVMMQVRIERLAATDKLWQKGVPMSVCNEYLKLGMPKYKDWDKGYLPFNVSPVGEQVDPTKDPSFAETPDPDKEPPDDQDDKEPPAQAMRKLFAARGEDRATSRREAQWKAHMVYRQGAVKNYERKFTRVLMLARGETLAKLAGAAHGSKAIADTSVAKAGAGEAFMFDIGTFAAEFKDAMDSAGHTAFDEAGQQVYDELGKEDPWVSPPPAVKAFLAVRENKLKDVPQEVFDTIKTQLAEGTDAGESIKDLSARVRGTFNEIGKKRGHTIAMTETTAAFGTARQASMAAAGVQWKEWLTSHNSNVRPTHAEAEGQIRQIHEPFDVGGEELDFPGDPKGSPEEVINCHCVAIAAAGPADGSKDSKSIQRARFFCAREKRKSA